jgi:hypothetical protein
MTLYSTTAQYTSCYEVLRMRLLNITIFRSLFWKETCDLIEKDLDPQQNASCGGSCRALRGLSVVRFPATEKLNQLLEGEEKKNKNDWRLFWVSANTGIRDLPRD